MYSQDPWSFFDVAMLLIFGDVMVACNSFIRRLDCRKGLGTGEGRKLDYY